jgi:hypothetical protein
MAHDLQTSVSTALSGKGVETRMKKTLYLFLVLLFSTIAVCAFGQGITTGTLAGTVVDQSGAVVQNAQVTAMNAATGAKYTQVTRADGGFTFGALPLGLYTVTVEFQGFQAFKLENVPVAVGESRQLGNLVLKPGASQTIEVTEQSGQLIETTQSQISTTFSTQQLQNLPFQGGFDNVALLEPGVARTHSNNFSNTNGAGFSSQGQRGRSNNFEIDGQSNNDNSVAGPQIFFSNQDALAGLQVVTNTFSAQYGRNMGSIVNYLTKSGTNSWHGSAFEFYEANWGESFDQGHKSPFLGFCASGQNSATTGCQPATLPRFVQNRFGGTLGFPVIKDKLWAFGSTYFSRNHQGASPSLSGPTALTPTPAGLQTLQSAYPNNPAVTAIVNSGPYSVKSGNPQPVPGTSTLIPVSDGTTTTNVEFAQISRSVASLQNDQEDMGRLDWQPTTKDHLFVRYFYQDDPFINGGGSVPGGNWYNVPATSHSIGADWVRTFSPSWVNQARYSFQQSKVLFQGGAQSSCTVNSPDQCTSNINLGGSSTGILGFGYATNIPQGRTVKNTQVQDNATWSHGKHTFMFGGEWDYQNSPNPFLPNYAGAYTFGGFDAFLQQNGTLTLGNGNFTIHFTEPDAAGYIQDDWRVIPSLTLNMGLRWEFFGQAINLLHNETMARESNPATAFWDQSLPLSERTFPDTKQNYKNFQPRLGFAWAPERLNSKFVLRGGFAINFDPAFYNIFLNSATAAPVVNLGTINCAGTCLPASGVFGAATRSQNLSKIPLGVNPNLRNETFVTPNFHNPYAESWQLGIEYGFTSNILMQVRYAGNHSVGLFQSLNANPQLLTTAQAFPGYFTGISFCTDKTQVGYGYLDCMRRRLRLRANTAFSNFNALEFQLDTRAWHGLTTTFSYTYSRTIDNASEIFGTFSGGTTVAFAENPFNTDVAERGLSGVSIPHVLSASFVYDVPWFKGQSGWYGRLLGGFQLAGIYGYDSGQPATPFNFEYGLFGFPEMSSYCDENFNNSFSSAISTCRPILLNKKAPMQNIAIYNGAYSDGIANPGNYYDLQSWINYLEGVVAAPTAVDPSQEHWLYNNRSYAKLVNNPFPGVGRNTLGSQSWNNLDATIYKTTKIKENLSLQLSVSAFNVLNRQYFGTFDPEIDDVSFMDKRYCGQNLCSNGGGNRNIELGAHFVF